MLHYCCMLDLCNISGSGKSSALTPHMDALARTLTQMDVNQEYIQFPNKDNNLSFEQPFIISNVQCIADIRSSLCISYNIYVTLGNGSSCISEFNVW